MKTMDATPGEPSLPAELNRREFVQRLGAGLLLSVAAPVLLPGTAGAASGGARQLALGARIHLAKDGTITVLTGKVEGGNGARTELTQAAAEELRLPASQVKLIMADTSLVPDDGSTAGSRSTPSTVPAVRRGAAALRELLFEEACKKWNTRAVEVANGKACRTGSDAVFTYADLANTPQIDDKFKEPLRQDVTLTPVKEWKVLSQPTPRPNGVDLVTGAHKFPSDIRRPGMLYGKILRAPAYGAKLVSIALGPAQALEGVLVARDGQFVGFAAPSTFQARQAMEAAAKTAKWEHSPHVSDKEVFEHLQRTAERPFSETRFRDEVASAKTVLRQTFTVPYVQHAPLEPRAAVAEWKDGKVTVWTGTQNPFGVRGELARALNVAQEDITVIVPDFGSGFGGKHQGDAAVEAARLAKAVGKPVSVCWTREEEFTWAYFRPAAVIEAAATLDAQGTLTSWHFVNINSGGAAVDTPYRTGRKHCETVSARSPMRQGSYRALAATANTFAREAFMDELAAAARKDPLQFRLAHLENQRLRAVLEEAAKRFGWEARKRTPNVGYGLACSTEKGSFVATCAEIEVKMPAREIVIKRLCEVFECGAILNPANLLSQVQGQIIMALGPALREEMFFENGVVANASFRRYPVPRFADVPPLDIHLLNRPDLDSVGGGETPLIAVAAALANAVYDATGTRIRKLPIKL